MRTDRRPEGYVRRSRVRRQQRLRLLRSLSCFAALTLLAGLGAVVSGIVQTNGPEIDAEELRALELDDAISGAPGGVAASPDGRSLLVVDGDGRDRLRVVNSAEIAEGSVPLPGPLAGAASLTRDPRSDQVLAAVSGEGDLQRVDVSQRRTQSVAVPGRADELFVDGLAVDGVGTVYGLHDDELAIYPERNASGDLEHPMLTVPLGERTQGDAQGIAVHQGEIYVGDPDGGRIVVLDRTATVVRTLNIDQGAGGPLSSFALAPSGDRTDDPSTMSVYVVDAGTPEQTASLRELSTTSSVQTAYATTEDSATLIQDINTGDPDEFSPQSPDSSGITHLAFANRLLLSDSEVNEYDYYADVNMWNLSITAPPTITATGTTRGDNGAPEWSREPTGVAYGGQDLSGNHRIFTTDDNNQRITETLIGPDNLPGTADDQVVGYFSTVPYGNTDPEDITYDTTRGWLHVADGSNSEIFTINPGPNQLFEGGGDDIITHFDAAPIRDPEGISHHAGNDTLMVVDYRPQSGGNFVLAEFDVDGTLRRTVDISDANPNRPAGGTWAPSSSGSGQSFWIVDRGIDGSSPSDGRLYEVSIPPLPGSGPPEPEIAVTPTALDFGDVLTGTSKQKTVVVTNSGSADLTVSSLSLGGADQGRFSVDSPGGGFAVPPGGTQEVDISFAPDALGPHSAVLTINSDDADEAALDVPLSGQGVDTLPPPPEEVRVGATYVGGSSGSTSVPTDHEVAVTPENLYVAYITSKASEAVVGVSGLGGTWTQVDFQCGGRSQTSVAVFITTDAVSSSAVTATLAGGVTNAAISVIEYLGVDLSAPIGSLTSLNTIGTEGGCSGGNDSDAYSTSIDVESSSLAVGAVSIRHRSHTPGAGATERVQYTQGAGGSSSGLAVTDLLAEAPGPVTVSGELSGNADWAVVAFEIRAGATAPPPAPEISVAPASVAFAPTPVGEESIEQVTVSNTGSAPLSVTSLGISGAGSSAFGVDPGPFSVPAGGSVLVDVSFLPGSVASFAASLDIASNDADESVVSVALSGDGIAPQEIDVSPTTLPFGEVQFGNSRTEHVIVSNSGSVALQVSSIDLGGSDPGHFSVDTPAPFSVPAGGSVQVDVTFTPNTPALERTAEMTIESDDADEPSVVVTLTGTGTLTPPDPEPDIAVSPSELDFGSVQTGDTAALDVTVSNTGDEALTVSSITFAGAGAAHFSVVPDDADGFEVAPGASKQVAVTFAPGTGGPLSATMTVSSNDPDEGTVDVGVSGEGVAPLPQEISVNPASLAFGPVAVESSASDQVTVSNTGDVDLTVSSIGMSGPNAAQFSIVDPEDANGFVVPAGGFETVDVSFTPATETNHSATMTINSDDADEGAVAVPLSGAGVPPPAPEIAVTPASLSYGPVVVGSSASDSVVVSNTGDAALTVTSIAVGGPDPTQFTIVDPEDANGFVVAAGGSESVEVSFAPDALRPFSATLTISSDDADESTVDVPLSGEGTDQPPPPSEVIPGPAFTGGSSGSPNVSTTDAVTVTPGNLYVAYISSKSFKTVDSMSGLGGTWFLVDQQCGGRMQTGINVFATTDASSSTPVTASLSGSPTNAAIAVIEYAGVDLSNPFGATTNLNTNGVAGACTGGSDSNSYATPLNVAESSLVVGAASIRHRSHAPGAGFVERVEYTQGGGGSASGLAVMDLLAGASGPVSVEGTLGGRADWALVALEIRPGDAGPPPPPAPEIAVSPTSLSFGPVVTGNSAQGQVVVSNSGNATLTVSSIGLTGSGASAFSVDSGAGGFSVPPGGDVSVDVSFSPTAEQTYVASMTVFSDDADESEVVVSLSGEGVDELPPPPSEVLVEETYASGSADSTSVSTATPVSYNADRLYVAYVSTKKHKATTGVSGLGGTWTAVNVRCAGRQQTGVSVFATTSATSSSVVTATLEGAPTNAAIVVVEYSGADLASPFGATTSANSNGVDGQCTGGSDGSSYSVGLTVDGSSHVAGAISLRHRSHEPGGAMTELVEFTQGTGGGGASGIAVVQLVPDATGPVTLQGSFNGNVDWAVVFVEIRIGS